MSLMSYYESFRMKLAFMWNFGYQSVLGFHSMADGTVAVYKPCAGKFVVKWVTISDSCYCMFCSSAVFDQPIISIGQYIIFLLYRDYYDCLMAFLLYCDL